MRKLEILIEGVWHQVDEAVDPKVDERNWLVISSVVVDGMLVVPHCFPCRFVTCPDTEVAA